MIWRQRIPVPAAIMLMPSNADIRMPKMKKMNEMNKKEAFVGKSFRTPEDSLFLQVDERKLNAFILQKVA